MQVCSCCSDHPSLPAVAFVVKRDRMSQVRILIVDSGENSCVRGNCHDLHALVERTCPGSAEYVCRTFGEVEGQALREPDLVVFRAIDASLARVVRLLRQQWTAAS